MEEKEKPSGFRFDYVRDALWTACMIAAVVLWAADKTNQQVITQHDLTSFQAQVRSDLSDFRADVNTQLSSVRNQIQGLPDQTAAIAQLTRRADATDQRIHDMDERERTLETRTIQNTVSLENLLGAVSAPAVKEHR